MFLILYIIWILFNGKITAEILILGFFLTALLYLFICKFMHGSLSKDLFFLKKAPLLFIYTLLLLKEIIKANFATLHLILTSRYEPEPILVHFKSDLKSDMARTILANSITLTPGTITVSLKEDEFTVHCLDRDFKEGLYHSPFIPLLQKLEAGYSQLPHK